MSGAKAFATGYGLTRCENNSKFVRSTPYSVVVNGDHHVYYMNGCLSVTDMAEGLGQLGLLGSHCQPLIYHQHELGTRILCKYELHSKTINTLGSHGYLSYKTSNGGRA